MAKDSAESRSLMVASDSDSDSDVTEFSSRNGANSIKSNGFTMLRIQKTCDYCPALTATQMCLVLSGVINLLLFFILLWTSTGYFHDDCIRMPSENASVESLESNSSGSGTSITRPSSTQVTDTSPLTNPNSLPPPPSGNEPCVMSSVTCGTVSQRVEPATELDYVNIFKDLTPTEISAAVSYVSSQPDFSISSSSGNSIYGAELYPPEKSSALQFLDSGGSRPPREALVTVVFSTNDPQVVRQYVVGPLPDPSYHRLNPRMSKDVPAKFLSKSAYGDIYRYWYSVMQRPDILRLMLESFGATVTACGDKCLMPLAQKTSFGFVNATTLTFGTYYKTEFPTIHPVPFQAIVQEEGPGRYAVRSVFYAGATFSSIDDLVQHYDQGTILKVRRQFPVNAPGEDSIPGSLNMRGVKFPPTPHSPPRQYEPRGPRYSVVDQHVKHLQWSFNLRQSVESGPQLWDVRWGGERVVYELSLQEVVVLYAGANPGAMFSLLSDSAFGLGNRAKGLVPGVDCPEHATFLPTNVLQAESSEVEELPNALCVFEHNSGVPLRRHRSEIDGREYNGLADYVLIVRTIITEFNYDYIFDFVFHLNGALEARVYATGYIMSQWFHYGEDPFGFRVHEDVVGSLHHHLFNFKVDMDIGGTSNRYETLDLAVDDRAWPWLSVLRPNSNASSSAPAGRLEQISFKHHVRKTEQDAVYHYDFDHPKYHIFYNEKAKNKFGNPRAYRVEGKGFSKQILPDGHPAVRNRKWMQYQMAVTSHKEEEGKSSSIFSMYDAESPTIDFENYVKDDDNILDKDLVTWVTLGMHHIPHTEDIPNTPTPGTEAAILLLPFNYFPEDPSMGSRDAVRLSRSGVRTSFQLYGAETDFTCKPRVYGWMKDSNAQSYP